MRYGVVSDVHANLPALQAVLEVLAAQGVDRYLCTGDLVGYGPHPDACIDLLASLGTACVAGNHDLLALGELSGDRSGSLARQTRDWTQAVLAPASRAFLAALPRTLRVDDLLLAHGSPHDPEEYVRRSERAFALLGEVERADPGVRALLLGHTHLPWAYGQRAGTRLRGRAGTVALDPADRYLLNAGSVGQSRDRTLLARGLVLDLAAGTAEFLAVEYDVAAVRADLARAGLPTSGYQLRPSRAETAGRAAQRLRGRLARREAPP